MLWFRERESNLLPSRPASELAISNICLDVVPRRNFLLSDGHGVVLCYSRLHWLPLHVARVTARAWSTIFHTFYDSSVHLLNLLNQSVSSYTFNQPIIDIVFDRSIHLHDSHLERSNGPKSTRRRSLLVIPCPIVLRHLFYYCDTMVNTRCESWYVLTNPRLRAEIYHFTMTAGARQGITKLRPAIIGLIVALFVTFVFLLLMYFLISDFNPRVFNCATPDRVLMGLTERDIVSISYKAFFAAVSGVLSALFVIYGARLVTSENYRSYVPDDLLGSYY